MRLIDADELKKHAVETYQANGVELEPIAVVPVACIDNAPTVEPTFKPIAEVKFDKEQLQEIVDKAKAEILESVERPQGEWLYKQVAGGICNEYPYCSVCKIVNDTADNFCPNCGADMRSVDKGLQERAISDLYTSIEDTYKNLRGEE